MKSTQVQSLNDERKSPTALRKASTESGVCLGLEIAWLVLSHIFSSFSESDWSLFSINFMVGFESRFWIGFWMLGVIFDHCVFERKQTHFHFLGAFLWAPMLGYFCNRRIWRSLFQLAEWNVFWSAGDKSVVSLFWSLKPWSIFRTKSWDVGPSSEV